MTTAQKDILARAINTAARAVGSNPVIPLLSNVLLESNNGKSRVAGTNLEIGIGYTFPSSGETWRTCVPARVFASLVDALGAEEVELELNANDQSILIKTESSTSNIRCAPADEFPDIPRLTNPSLSLPVTQFKEMVQRVAFASAVNREGSTLEGVQLSYSSDGKRLIMFAVDGFHLSYEEAPLFKAGKRDNMPCIIKGTTLETISRTLPEEGILEVEVQPTKALFHCGAVDVVTQLLNGDFPDHVRLKESMAAPKTTITISTMELMRAARQLRVIAADTGVSKLEIKGMLLRYSAITNERGDADVTLMAVKKGADATVGLSVHKLYEFLEICKTSQVVIDIVDGNSPILFRMEGFNDFYHVIMPMGV